jgi:hypothetical protein
MKSTRRRKRVSERRPVIAHHHRADHHHEEGRGAQHQADQSERISVGHGLKPWLIGKSN